jgi:hypothetical protein
MRDNSRVSSFDDLLARGGYTSEGFDALPASARDAHVRAHTRFADWETMKSAAVKRWARAKLDLP